MNPMHVKRMRLIKRIAFVSAAVLLFLTVYFGLLVPSFQQDEAIDYEQSSFIQANFGLPTASSFKGEVVRRIHFMHQTHMVLPDYRRYVASWRQVYPNYDIYFWTDADIDSLVAVRYPQLYSFYRSQLVNPLERSDFGRILIVHSFGGWYADMDTGCHQSAENITKEHSIIVPMEPYLHAMVVFKRSRLVNNAVMYSRPGHPFWMYYVHRIAKQVATMVRVRTKDDAVFSTGPVTMTKTMEQFLAAYASRCGLESMGKSRTRNGDYWCPFIPSPRQYSPLIDNSSYWLPTWARILCLTVSGQPDITSECSRLQSSGFVNRLPDDAFTYHRFLHLTGQRKLDRRDNVSQWGLGVRLHPLRYLLA